MRGRKSDGGGYGHLIKSLWKVRYRPYGTLIVIILGVWIIDSVRGVTFFDEATFFAIFQEFAQLSLVALAMGLLIVIGEFDLSIGALFALGGIMAARFGGSSIALGLLIAVGFGTVVGCLQGSIVSRFKLNSAAVTLGGLIALGGLGDVLTNGGVISVNAAGAAAFVNHVILGVLTTRSVIALGIVLLAAVAMAKTPLGPVLYAAGGSRRAVVIMGISPALIVVIAFGIFEALAALSGALLSDSLLTASATGLANVLVPSVAAAILGGVSVMGGEGTPLGIAAGAFGLSAIEVGFVTAATWFSGLLYGVALLLVAVSVGPDLMRRITTHRVARRTVERVNLME